MDTVKLNIADIIFRSAIFEGMADMNGFPTDKYIELYRELAENNVKNIITGFTYISPDGRAVHPGQAGIDSVEKIPYFRQVTDSVHKYGSKIYLQIAHTGRQTSGSVTKQEIFGASGQRSEYFRSEPKILSTDETYDMIETFADSVEYAKLSGFDGIQLHAAHGYLIHQFLHPYINDRKDEFGINTKTGIGDNFLRQIILSVRKKCGTEFPVLVKISASDDLPAKFSEDNFISLIGVLDEMKVAAIEISYGTMENALNIFRGSSIPFDTILNHNFRYRTKNKIYRILWKLLAAPHLKQKIIKFSEMYNLKYAKTAKTITDIPIICVGGFRRGNDILNVIESGYADFVSLCRPFICEPDLINKMNKDQNYISKCINCNICAIMCDSKNGTRCYNAKKERS
jgi:2,4-dienoyl-CoA reductase-like NADH-dependent reductase (Old Yellow Enzyme family)